MSASEVEDRRVIRDLIENWAVWRDALMWDRFRTVWHDDGRMMATWFQGTADEFIKVSQEGYERGVRILHFLGGSSVDIAGARAIAQTKMTISQRASVDGILCDVVCTGRFYDFFEKRNDRWGLALRQPIYEKDRLDPIDPAAELQLDRNLLAQFPEGYRHLAYLQTRIGYKVKTDMPGLDGPEVAALFARARIAFSGNLSFSRSAIIFRVICSNSSIPRSLNTATSSTLSNSSAPSSPSIALASAEVPYSGNSSDADFSASLIFGTLPRQARNTWRFG